MRRCPFSAIPLFLFLCPVLRPRSPYQANPQSHAQNDETRCNSKHTRPASRSSERPIAVVKPEITPNANADTNSYQQTSEPDSWRAFLRPEWWMVYLTALYVLAATLSFLAIWRQGQIAERMARIAQQTAEAAKRSADAAHDTVATLKASESAFITSENWNLEDFSWGEAGQGSMDLVNAGSTAARIIRVILKYEIVECLPETPNYTGDFPTSPTLFIAGKGKFKLKFPLDPTKIEKELLAAVLAGEKFIYFYGLADYETLFREVYTVGFVAQYHYSTQQFTLPTAPNYTYHRRKTE